MDRWEALAVFIAKVTHGDQNSTCRVTSSCAQQSITCEMDYQYR